MWAALALVGAAGLPQLHVNNSLAAWAPRQESSEGLATYLVVGFEASAVDAGHLEQALRRLPSVAWCFGPASEAVLRIAGVSPQRLVVGDDGRYAGIYCFARPGVRPDRLWQEVGRVLDNESRGAPAMFAMSGSAAYAAALNEVSQRRMPLIIPIR